MALLGSKDDLTDEQQSVLEFVKKRWEAADKLHSGFRDRWDVYYGLSRNYRKMARDYASASPRDRDTLLEEFRRVFGEELFIPYIYTVIETTVPRVFATDPAISVMPLDAEVPTYEACEPVKRLFERDAKKAGLALRHQETVRSGLRYGLGVQKLWWEKKMRSGFEIKPNQSTDGYQVQDNNKIVVYEGPQNLSVDIYDFRWDPIAYDLASCGYVIHRTWRTLDYVKDKVAEGKQRRADGLEGGWEELDMEKVEGLATAGGRSEVWASRMQSAGMGEYDSSGNKLVEVWEYHDRDKVCTVLGKELLVQEAPNPFMHGDFPFQIYRPTIVEHEFAGIGEAEPIAHLQYELNQMRGQRRDAATLALSPPFFYANGMLNPKRVAWGPGVFNPTDAPPDEVIKQVQIRDLPASSVSEEEALKRDIEMTSGISEASTGGGGEETATGTQLVQAAANQRIKQKIKNFHNEVLEPETCQKLELYRQNITTPDQAPGPIRVDASSQLGGSPGEGYSFVQVGPDQIQANIEVSPVDGSTEPENTAQKRADVVQLVDAITPFAEQLDPAETAKRILLGFDVDQPEKLLKPPGPTVEQTVEAFGKTLQEQGVDEEEIHTLLEAVYQRLQSPPPLETGPGGSEPEAQPSQNGSAPEKEPVTAPGG